MDRLDRRIPIALTALGLASACGGAPDEPVTITPAIAFVGPGATQQFDFGRRSNSGLNESIPASYSVTGGTITSDGMYTAGSVPGTYRVIATERGGPLADTAEITVTPAGAHNYVSRFPLAEDPISDGGQWINGGVIGLDWTDVSTSPGLAIGHQIGADYTDGTAILGGSWGPDQAAAATVYTERQNDDCYQEVELRLRSTLSAHRATGYEVNFKASQTSSAYLQIVRWNGALGDFTSLSASRGAAFGVKNGDVIEATIVGNVITAYKNGVRMAQARDDVFTAGAPGMGFNLASGGHGCAGTNGDYGFTAFAASDAPAP